MKKGKKKFKTCVPTKVGAVKCVATRPHRRFICLKRLSSPGKGKRGKVVPVPCKGLKLRKCCQTTSKKWSRTLYAGKHKAR